MKQFKLMFHNKSFSEESLLINPKDYPSLTIGNIVEISSLDAVHSPLLLQVTAFTSDLLQKGYISIDQSIASNFQLKNYAEVSVKVVDNLKAVSIDSLELSFKDQYVARSDMWRLKKCLVNTCMYPNKKLEFYGIRCQVFEMYTKGEKVASGIVTDDTKIVYRSASSMVYLFIQMSCEMWDFDIYGDLYFEKAIDGFLPDLFSKWKKLSCNHDVTIVLFSRTFYEAESSDEFPAYMRECLQQDYKGRFYEDFYRVAVQNERYDDWSSTIILLKKLFNQYQNMVLNYHQKNGVQIPKAMNSTSSQGNFLEVLNMSLNVFEKHYMDRSFDRTGQLSVVITPGVGFFEVDRELTIITKQRIIDNGIGSDLVCLGEQPLHAVPLFKFYNKQGPRNIPTVVDDYNVPHWINLSFYSSPNQTIYTDFVPRIKLPTLLPDEGNENDKNSVSNSTRSRHASQPDPSFPVLFDYDEYDRQVFKVPVHSQTMRQTLSLQRSRKRKETPPCTSSSMSQTKSSEGALKLTASDPTPMPPYSQSHASSAAIAIPYCGSHTTTIASSYQSSIDLDNIPQRQYSREDIDSEETPPFRAIIGSDPSYESRYNRQLYTRRLKALVNPFNPSQITIKFTSNRRRWTHVFPLGGSRSKRKISSRQDNESSASNASLPGTDVRSPTSANRTSTSLQPTDSLSWLWGATGEQEWTPAITTGVDWKSLVIPACLPITTDYFPDRRSLQYDYAISDYSLVPEDIIAENAHPRYFQNDDDTCYKPLTTIEVYNELICQRLQQGFQIILLAKHPSFSHAQASTSPQCTPSLVKGNQAPKEETEECLLSIGRIFHRLNLEGLSITVTQYKPRHPNREIKVHYCYRFHAPDSDTYGVSWVNFSSEKLENYGWNFLDHYICMKGEGEFELKETLKYWRLKMLLLPAASLETKKIIEGSEHCDLYNEFSLEEKTQQKEGFLTFIEILNKIRRSKKFKLPTIPPRRSSIGTTAASLKAVLYRDRVSSNRIHDRPRMRSVSARMGVRVEPVMPSGRISPATEVDGRVVIPNLNTALAPLTGEGNDDNNGKFLDENSTDLEIIQMMQHPQDGLNFIIKSGWSSHTFISAEAVFWVLEHVRNIIVEKEAICLLQGLVEKELICHSSGAKSQPFVHGFYLYYITSPNDIENRGFEKENLDTEDILYLFQREWLEVELSLSFPLSSMATHYDFPSNDGTWTSPYMKLKFRCTNIEIDQGTKSGRQEWGQLRYQNKYRSYEAFEIAVEWMVATGNKAAELVQSWARKSNQYGLQLVPIPSDPFALPFSDDSDPLRGPIFIPLDLAFLIETSDQNMDESGLLCLQEKILCKFGFIPYRNPNVSSPPQYVHLSGSMFVMLPVQPKECKNMNGKHLSAIDLHQISSPHEKYITRHFSGIKNRHVSAMGSDTDTKIGFLWSWNYMITKRWKNTGTVDENFMRKVMQDFRAFCANQKGRLEDFWKCSMMLDFGSDPSMLPDLES